MKVPCHQCDQVFEAPAGSVEASCPSCGARVALTALATRATPAGASSLATLDAERLTGQVIEGYRLTRLIGGGGMGLVYEATAEDPQRSPSTVAIKVLAPGFADDADFVARFRREADALLRLKHPRLVEVYGKGEHALDGATYYYFIMEYFPGPDLRRLLEAEPLPVRTALAVARQVAEGLQYAHDHGIVHRDVKQANILVQGDPENDGTVKVVDFGVAQLAPSGQTMTHLTRSDLILGTFNYMSPEQRVDARAIDHRADIYALGVVVYEMLTKSLPIGVFERPSGLRSGLSRAMDRAVLAALRRVPAHRPASVLAYADGLEKALFRSRYVKRALASIGVAAGLSMVVGWGGYALFQSSPESVDTKTADTTKTVKAPESPPPLPQPDPIPQVAVENTLTSAGSENEAVNNPSPQQDALTPPLDPVAVRLAERMQNDLAIMTERVAKDRAPRQKAKVRRRKSRKSVQKLPSKK